MTSHSPTSHTPSRSPIGAGFIARFYGLEQCGPYANLEENPTGNRIASQTYSKPLTNPLHLAVGREFEQEQLLAVGSRATRVYGPTDTHGLPPDGPRSTGEWATDYGTSTDEFIDLVKKVANDGRGALPSIAWQAKLKGQIGVWPVVGKADLVAIVPAGTSDPYDVTIYVLEAKSSVTKWTAHRIQATVYGLLIKQALAGTGITAQLKGSIVTPENDLSRIPLGDLETFEFSTMTATLEAALSATGSLTEAINGNYNDMPRRLAPRCAACPHEQVCLTNELETPGLGLGLLQLDEGVQETLTNIGITSLEEFAALVDLSGVDRYGEVDAWEDIPFAKGTGAIIDEIRERTNISNLRKLAVGAARYVDEVDPSNSDYWPGAIQGSGYGLPADDPSHIGNTQYPPNSLIKVFITVVPDPVRNCVAALAAHVTSSQGEENVVAYPTRLPRSSPQLGNQEQALLFRFFKQLGSVIDQLAPNISTETDPDGNYYTVDDGFPHLYFFTEGQREALMNAVRRHEQLREADAVRSLLGLRGAISNHATTNVPDQEMVSVLSRELRQRFEMRFIGLGLVQTVAQFWARTGWFGWDVPPYGKHGSKPSLTEIFAADLFEIEVDYTHSGGSLKINHSGSPRVLDGAPRPQFGSSYPMANRHETTLPAAYIWAERDRLTPKWASNDEERAAIQRYRYQTDSHTDRITQEDIETLLERMSAALVHIEQGLEVPANGKSWPDAGKDARVPKAPLNVSQLTQLSQGSGSLASTVQEYALLEHDSGVQRAIYNYRQPLDERVESGRSLVLTATRAWEDDSGRYTNSYLEGEMDDPNSFGAGGSANRTIPLSVEKGDWMVITELDMGASPLRIRALGDRAHIIRSTVVKVEEIDRGTGYIRLNCMDTGFWLKKNVPCVTSHRSPNVIDGTASGQRPQPTSDHLMTVLQAGRKYVLDEFADSIDKMRAFPALTAAANATGSTSGNSLYDHINDLYNR